MEDGESKLETLQDFFDHMSRKNAQGLKAKHDALLVDIGESRSSPEATRRLLATAPAATCPRCPHQDDIASPPWKPPPSAEEALASSAGDGRPRFLRYPRQNGECLEGQKFLKQKHLNQWVQDRIGAPSRLLPESKGYRARRGEPVLNEVPPTWPSQKGQRFHAHPELFAETSDDSCGSMHRNWLKSHYRLRDKEMYPEYHARNALEEAKRIKAEHEQRRQLTRDLTTRKLLTNVKQSENVKKALTKLRMVVHASHNLHASVGLQVSSVRDEEEEDRRRLERAKSAPCLQIAPPVPSCRARHLRKWAGPDHPLRSIRHTTPWREVDERRELDVRSQSVGVAR
eukprot:TRINITY_DN31688_c0_g1_i1.p1 TRINITY_DN31688_c0_g1~~TRINITY_DN31688_c0_g1_i1.p1  ORF type:complete len:342 (+),score=63.74 TRINITY_DN31688_c0_g1_i1:59-1084(+)